MATITTILEQIYGIKLLNILSERYGNNPVVLSILNQYYQSYAVLVRRLEEKYDDTLSLKKILIEEYTLKDRLIKEVSQIYGISQSEIKMLISENYNLNFFEFLIKKLEQLYVISNQGSTLLQSPTISVEINGLESDFYHITIEIDEGDYAIRGEIHPADQDNFMRFEIRQEVYVVISETTYLMIVESKKNNKTEIGTEGFVVSVASPTILLDFPYADPVTKEFTGNMASVIVSDLALACGITVVWQMVDWYIPTGVLYSSKESPLEIIRKIVSAAGGVLQSSPSGSLICRAEYPLPIPLWQTSSPSLYLTDMDNFFSVESEFELRDGYNKFLITDESPSRNGFTLETKDIDRRTKNVLVYFTPWDNDKKVVLETSGGTWVTIIDEGISEEEITEQIEIISGEGSVSKPMYSKISDEYRQFDLGEITFSEDGQIGTAVDGNSLVEIKYITKYYLFRVSDPNIEDVQFYPV